MTVKISMRIRIYKDADEDKDEDVEKFCILGKEWFEDVEGKGEGLDSCCARSHYHAPKKYYHPP